MYTTTMRRIAPPYLGMVLVGCCMLFLCIYRFSVRPTCPSIVIVPHHDLVKDMRSFFLQKSFAPCGMDIRHVVILSPNHFDTGSQNILSTDRLGTVSDQNVSYDSTLGHHLGILIDADAFWFEHGVSHVLPDIARVFPHASVVPIIIKKGTPKSALYDLAQALNTACVDRCVIVASIDFTHEENALVSVGRDVITEALLRKKDPERLLSEGTADSVESLFVIATLAKGRTLDWNLYAQTHSGALMGDMQSTNTTSHIFGVYK